MWLFNIIAIAALSYGETPEFQRDLVLPMTYVSPSFAHLKEGVCKFKIKRQIDNSVFVQIMTRAKDRLNDETYDERGGLWRGEALKGSLYPLRPGMIEIMHPESRVKSMETWMTYDKSVFRLVDVDRETKPSTISVYEFGVDPSLTKILFFTYQLFSGEDLSTAKPLEDKIQCSDLSV